MTPWLDDGDVRCPCGCGATFSPVGSRGRQRTYATPACSLRVNRVSGGGDGRRHTPETRARLSVLAKRPRPHLRGAANGMSGRTGERNPNWKGGVSAERQRLYASSEWREVVRAVKRRDGGCVECGSSTDLHIHHVWSFAEFPSLRLNPLNLQTLCRSCHYDKHRRGGGSDQ